ncbi:MAG: hypothetical protein AAFZ09_02320, partial [Pseudomonadota bacterium]
PEGIGRTWNGGVCCGEASTSDVDDVGFTAAMIDALQAEADNPIFLRLTQTDGVRAWTSPIYVTRRG